MADMAGFEDAGRFEDYKIEKLQLEEWHKRYALGTKALPAEVVLKLKVVVSPLASGIELLLLNGEEERAHHYLAPSDFTDLRVQPKKLTRREETRAAA